MYYPDLRSLEDVDNLPIPEFNLRLHCVVERIRFEQGPNLGLLSPTEDKPKTTGGERMSFADILVDLKRREIAKQGGNKLG